MSLDDTVPHEFDSRLFEHVSDGLLVLDEGSVESANDAAASLLGASRERLVGTALSETDWGAALEDQLGTAETAISLRVDGTAIEGTAVPVEGATAVLLRPEAGGVVGRQATVLESLNGVASDLELSREEKITRMLEIVTGHLGVGYGFVTRVSGGTQEISHSVGGHPELRAGAAAPLSESYCRHTLEDGRLVAIESAVEDGYADDPAYRNHELECYLGVVLRVDGEKYGTVCFSDQAPHDGFDDRDESIVAVLADWLALMLERERYERERDQHQALVQSLFDSLPDPVYAFDPDGTILQYNDRFEAVTGYDPAELETMSLPEFLVEDDRDRVDATVERVLDGERVSVEATMETADGSTIPHELSGAPLYDGSGEIVGLTGVGRDVTEQQTHRDRLSAILETTRSLMQARDRQHVGELAANAATELLDEELSIFRLYDGDSGTLEPISATPAAREVMGDRPVYDIGEGYPGTVFASGEPTIVDDFAAIENDFEYGHARSAMYYPVGVHGIMTVASREAHAFDETDQHVLGLLATSAAAACMRAKRMQEIRDAREQSDRLLERVNGLVENTVEVLVQARTREELESGVVSELATTEPYAFAWVGQPDVTTEQLTASAWAGEIDSGIQGQTFDLSQANEPVARAYHEGTTQVLTDTEGVYGPLSGLVAGSDVEAVVIIPLVYKDATYGVLSVCAEDSGAFDDREQVILDALGRAVANAINAVERGRILDATEIIELEFAVDGQDLLVNRLSGSDGQLEAVGTDYRSDGAVRLYLSAENVDTGSFIERARADREVIECTTIVEHDDECLVELAVEESLLAMLAEYGAVTKSVVAEGGSARFTVELPAEAEARELFELVEQRHPGTDLLGYHERQRPVETRQDFKAALGDRLTDRQETALRTAYLGGFFDWPREIDGNELAEAMDIARPTYHQHLRAAQAKVFEELFE